MSEEARGEERTELLRIHIEQAVIIRDLKAAVEDARDSTGDLELQERMNKALAVPPTKAEKLVEVMQKVCKAGEDVDYEDLYYAVKELIAIRKAWA